MEKKKIILFIIISVVTLVIVIIAGLMLISPTLFFAPKDADTDADKPQIADDITGELELIGSEEELNGTEIENDLSPTNPDYSVWDELGIPDPTAGMEDIDESNVGNFEGPIEVEDDTELTESVFYLNNPVYLNRDTNLGTNGFHNLYACIVDYFDYYFPEEPKEYEGIVIEGSYKDKGDYRSFLLEVYKEDGTTWLIECDYVVSMNYYEFFCDEINPRPKTGED